MDLFPRTCFVSIVISRNRYIVTRFENDATNLLKIYEH